MSSSHLISALLISSHLFSHVIKVSSSQLFSSHPSTDQPVSYPRSSSTHLSCSARQKALSVREKYLAKKTLGAESFCTQTLETQMHVHTLQKPSRKTLYYKACTKHFPALLCNTKLAQSTFQYYYIYLYYKACAKHFPVLLCTTKLAQSTSQYYSVHLCTTKLAQSTFQYYYLYYKACTKHFPVLLFLYYKACTKHFPVLLCTT